MSRSAACFVCRAMTTSNGHRCNAVSKIPERDLRPALIDGNRMVRRNDRRNQMPTIHSLTANQDADDRNDVLTDWLRLISSEYREIPDLCLTKPQVRRLWNLDVTTSEAVLAVLESSGFLRRTRAGAYVRSTP